MMLRHQHHTIQNQLREQNRTTRQIQQSNMMPAPHMHLHRGIPQQVLSMAHSPHPPIHHMQTAIPQRQPLVMGTNPQNGLRCIITLCILVLLLNGVDANYGRQMKPYTIENVDLLFGPSGCIEGTMVSLGMNRQSGGAGRAMVQFIQQPHQLKQQQQQHKKKQHSNQDQTQNSRKLSESLLSNQENRLARDHSPSNPNHANNTDSNLNLTNMKEKTPMCLVNELARFNKIQHQYRLTNEQGPAHKKRFTVTLKLGEEEYVADGPSIKKAQHSAATEALNKTWYRQPPPKPRGMRISSTGKPSSTTGNFTGHLPPTVELNALAMKRGEATTYTFKQAPAVNTQFIPNFGNPNFPNQPRVFPPQFQSISRPYHGRSDGLYLVTLKVGERQFVGKGLTAQAARHDAASRALEQLRQLPLPENISSSTINVENGLNPGIDDHNSELKSPVSLVHETALKRGFSVGFEVISESGKPHIRTFATKCIVGDKVTLGEGSSKKVSKKRAAELMLDELKRLPPISGNIPSRSIRLKRKPPATKKKSRNLIKDYQEPRPEADTSEDFNPISRLVQIQQAKKEREPVYTLIEEKGAPRKREFLMEVSVGDFSATGIGSNKKQGKRAAAEALLTKMGYSKPQALPLKTSIKQTVIEQNEKSSVTTGEFKTKNVSFSDDEQIQERPQINSGSGGRQLVPGLLLVDGGLDSKLSTGPSVEAVAEELREQQENSPSGIAPKDQLKYLAELLNFQVEFSDFPKNFQGGHKEYLSLVSLNTYPPQVCHGHGPTTSISRDRAALTALRTLSKLGLDSVTNTQNDKTEKPAAPDVLHINKQAQNNILNSNIDK